MLTSIFSERLHDYCDTLISLPTIWPHSQVFFGACTLLVASSEPATSMPAVCSGTTHDCKIQRRVGRRHDCRHAGPSCISFVPILVLACLDSTLSTCLLLHLYNAYHTIVCHTCRTKFVVLDMCFSVGLPCFRMWPLCINALPPY